MKKLILALTVLAALPLTGCEFTDTFAENCRATGGQVVSKGHIDYGLTPSGRVTWVYRDTRFCKNGPYITDVE